MKVSALFLLLHTLRTSFCDEHTYLLSTGNIKNCDNVCVKFPHHVFLYRYRGVVEA